MDRLQKLRILTDAAKYDVACTSSGTQGRNIPGGVGSCAAQGICHSFSADGRCISLLKVLLSNDCAYDCRYCTSRRSSPPPRAAGPAGGAPPQGEGVRCRTILTM